ncbi:MAG: hypothetical protein L3J23_04385 [Flavobacteriaceae bacterium]|nr:hypothetical protein [Flavobacteriaceae bacterium]
MKVILRISVFLTLINCKDNSNSLFWKDVQLNEDQVYLVFRGTKSKEGFFAKDFNIRDTLSSHIGILINDKTKWEIYHIIDFKDKNRSDFRKQSLKDFFDSKKEDINYVSFWEIDNIDSNEFQQIKKELNYYLAKFIKFDKLFTLEDSTKMYCSEFIFKVLHKVDSINFNFQTHKKKLNGVYATYFRKDTLEYYPVDVFQNNKNIRKIKEWNFK